LAAVDLSIKTHCVTLGNIVVPTLYYSL